MDREQLEGEFAFSRSGFQSSTLLQDVAQFMGTARPFLAGALFKNHVTVTFAMLAALGVAEQARHHAGVDIWLLPTLRRQAAGRNAGGGARARRRRARRERTLAADGVHPAASGYRRLAQATRC